MEKNMKSLVRLGAILGIVGCTLLGPSPIGNMSALALPEPQILEKLGEVPVFLITDGQNSLVLTSVPKQGEGQTSNASLARIFISQKDAQAFVEQLKTVNPQLVARVTPMWLEGVYRLAQETKGNPDQPLFAFVPAAQQVQSAKTVLQQTGQQVNEFNGVPLFFATGGPENIPLTIQRGEKVELPLFFSKEDLQENIDAFKQQQPNLTATIKIEVVNLEGVMEDLQTKNDPFLSQLILIPSQESLEFVRSLPPAGAGNQNPQLAPNQTRPAPGSPAPAPARPAPASPAPNQTRPAPASPAPAPAPARPTR